MAWVRMYKKSRSGGSVAWEYFELPRESLKTMRGENNPHEFASQWIWYRRLNAFRDYRFYGTRAAGYLSRSRERFRSLNTDQRLTAWAMMINVLLSIMALVVSILAYLRSA